jgi:2-polyprenyl-6-methoxyphenol hydroxylase-like FAD-dependent oxidoreductase
LIIGGGTAGITVAASLKRHGSGAIDIAVVEPSDTHYYQPAFTLVDSIAVSENRTNGIIEEHARRLATLQWSNVIFGTAFRGRFESQLSEPRDFVVGIFAKDVVS